MYSHGLQRLQSQPPVSATVHPPTSSLPQPDLILQHHSRRGVGGFDVRLAGEKQKAASQFHT